MELHTGYPGVQAPLRPEYRNPHSAHHLSDPGQSIRSPWVYSAIHNPGQSLSPGPVADHEGLDEPIHPADLVERWICWETELSELSEVQMPRCYVPPCADQLGSCLELHVFCDASERAYGAVSYLKVEDKAGHIHVSFVMARSRVAPKKQLSMPRLELSAALSGAQLASTLRAELTLPIQRVIYWSDSTTVLTWLKSESCRYKVFVGRWHCGNSRSNRSPRLEVC